MVQLRGWLFGGRLTEGLALQRTETGSRGQQGNIQEVKTGESNPLAPEAARARLLRYQWLEFIPNRLSASVSSPEEAAFAARVFSHDQDVMAGLGS